MSPFDARKRAFLTALAEFGNVTRALAAAGVARETAYIHKRKDPEFAAQWDAALEAFADSLEDEARRRATEGVEKPVFYKGKVVGQVREYSDRLLEMMVRAKKPAEYKERSAVEMSGRLGLDLAQMTDEDLFGQVDRFALDRLENDPEFRAVAARIIAKYPALPMVLTDDDSDLL